MTEPIELAKKAALIAADRKAGRVVLLDMRGLSDLSDFVLICSGTNDNQTRAIAEALEETFYSQFAQRALAIEGKQSGQWILVDFGNLICHIFLEELRTYYALETLYHKAPRIEVVGATDIVTPVKLDI